MNDPVNRVAEIREIWAPVLAAIEWENVGTAVVAGAYRGTVMRLLAEDYPDIQRIVGYEPQLWAAIECLQTTRPFTACEVRPYAIGTEAGEFPMGEWETDGCSFLRVGSRVQGTGRMVEVGQEWRRADLWVPEDEVTTVDLLVLNAEGYEWKLLPYLAARPRLLPDQLAVQFHNGEAPGEPLEQLSALHEAMPMHQLVYDDFPRWVVWRAR